MFGNIPIFRIQPERLRQRKFKRHKTIIISLFLLILTRFCYGDANRPSILFCSGGIDRSPYLHLRYLKELHGKGFEVDYIETYKELTRLTPERINKYNVIVVNTTKKSPFNGLDETLSDTYSNMIINYVKNGGGLLLFTEIPNHVDKSLLKAIGLKILEGNIKETNPANIARLSNYPIPLPLFFTSNIEPSPISLGVYGVWYPMGIRYGHGMTSALVLDDNAWKSVVRTSRSSETTPAENTKDAQIFQSIKSPTIFAIREYGKGRIATTATYPQFSIGAGTSFTFNREVLSKGVNEKPSDFGRLLENTFHWLAQSSLPDNSIGGYKTRPDALIPKTKRKNAMDGFKINPSARKVQYSQDYAPKTFKGVIGVRSSLSDGTGTIAEYAETAKKVGLDFIVFCESFASMNQEKYQRLHEKCQKYSDDQLALVPGFTIKNNIGNRSFFIHDGTKWSNGTSKWPDDTVLSESDKTIFELQTLDKSGKFTGYDNKKAFEYLLNHINGNNNIGYVDWTNNCKGMRIPTQRLCAMAAVLYYRNCALVENLTNEYLISTQSTMPPFPVSYNEITRPEELKKTLDNENAITCLNANNISGIRSALSWGKGVTVYLSNGPTIFWHPVRHAPMTFGSEEFSVETAFLLLGFGASSATGLKSIKIYNNGELYRLFNLKGQKEFRETLMLNATVAKNLVIIVEDINGKKAISGHRYFKKLDERMISYCGDHVNEGHMRSFHGPGGLPVCPTPILPIEKAGFTWDGGASFSGANPLVFFNDSRPYLETDEGQEDGGRFNQIPIMEAIDEGLVAVASEQKEIFSDNVLRVTNSWHTFGPTGGPSRLMEFTQRFQEYFPPVIDVETPSWMGVRTGIRPCVFQETITFKKDGTIKQLRLLSEKAGKSNLDYHIVIGRAPDIIEKTIDAGTIKKAESFTLKPGDWFGMFSPQNANSHLFVINKSPIILRISNKKSSGWLQIEAVLQGQQVKKGDIYDFELVSYNSSLDVATKTADELRDLMAYLSAPEGLKIYRGKRTNSPGLLSVVPENHAIDLSLDKPDKILHITLPLRIPKMNKNWTAGLFQKSGYVYGNCGSGNNRYRELGVDSQGAVHVPLYPDKEEKTHILAGNPISADENGKDLKINVIALSSSPYQWSIDVNNTTENPITTTLTQTMELPGLNFATTTITVQSGEYKVLVQ